MSSEKCHKNMIKHHFYHGGSLMKDLWKQIKVFCVNYSRDQLKHKFEFKQPKNSGRP